MRRSPPPAAPGYFSTQVTEARRFYLRLGPGGKGLTVASGGVEHCRPDYRIDRPDFPHAVLEFVARGAGTLDLGGRRHDLRPGFVFTYGPGRPHRIVSDAADPLVKYFVIVAFARLLCACRLGPGTVACVRDPEAVGRVFEDLIRHGLGDHPDRERMCAVCVQYLAMKIGDLALPPGEAHSPAFATYRRCRRFIEENAHTLPSARAAAEACHVDPAYLCRLFQRFGREPPARFLQHLRLSRAAELLQTTDLMVKEVAGQLGFSDPFHFSRAFRRAFGTPPESMRGGGSGRNWRGRTAKS